MKTVFTHTNVDLHACKLIQTRLVSNYNPLNKVSITTKEVIPLFYLFINNSKLLNHQIRIQWASSTVKKYSAPTEALYVLLCRVFISNANFFLSPGLKSWDPDKQDGIFIFVQSWGISQISNFKKSYNYFNFLNVLEQGRFQVTTVFTYKCLLTRM